MLWPLGRPLEAECRQRGHDAPQEWCSCGIYAHKDREWVHLNYGKQSGVIGIVKLWGRVVEQERGYRAQFADPEMLAVVDDLKSVVIYSKDGATSGHAGPFNNLTSSAVIFMATSAAVVVAGKHDQPLLPNTQTPSGKEMLARLAANYPGRVVVPYHVLKFGGDFKVTV